MRYRTLMYYFSNYWKDEKGVYNFYFTPCFCLTKIGNRSLGIHWLWFGVNFYIGYKYKQ